MAVRGHTLCHFLFVPITIGLSFLVALMQTAWVRTGHERWLRLTKFCGKLLLINFAMGVVTGIVQEFQFGIPHGIHRRGGHVTGRLHAPVRSARRHQGGPAAPLRQGWPALGGAAPAEPADEDHPLSFAY